MCIDLSRMERPVGPPLQFVRQALNFATRHVFRALTNLVQFRRISNLDFGGKLYRLSVCFNRGVWFDTLKNRVVTSSVILAPSESPAVFKS